MAADVAGSLGLNQHRVVVTDVKDTGDGVVVTLEIQPPPDDRTRPEFSAATVQAILTAQAKDPASPLRSAAVTSYVIVGAPITARAQVAHECGDGTYLLNCGACVRPSATAVVCILACCR